MNDDGAKFADGQWPPLQAGQEIGQFCRGAPVCVRFKKGDWSDVDFLAGVQAYFAQLLFLVRSDNSNLVFCVCVWAILL